MTEANFSADRYPGQRIYHKCSGKEQANQVAAIGERSGADMKFRSIASGANLSFVGNMGDCELVPTNTPDNFEPFKCLWIAGHLHLKFYQS